MHLRHEGAEHSILAVQNNIAITYGELGNMEKALSMERDVYSAKVKLLGKENEHTLLAASNYAISLNELRRFEEGKVLLRKTMPVARRVLGESHELTLKLRRNYALALYKGDGATLNDLGKAVTTLEDVERTARRVFGQLHPTTTGIEDKLQDARAALRARETLRFDKAARAGNAARGLVHYLGRLKKAKWRGSARKIAKFGRKVQKYNRLAVAAVEVSA